MFVNMLDDILTDPELQSEIKLILKAILPLADVD